MALAVVQVTHTENIATGSAVSPSITTTAGSLLVAVCRIGGSALWTQADGDVTDSKGGTWHLAVSGATASPGRYANIYYEVGGPRGSSHTVTLDPVNGPGAEDCTIALAEVTGADAVAPFDATTAGSAADATSPLSVTAGGAIVGNQIAFYAATVRNGTLETWTLPSGYTDIFTEPDGNSLAASTACYKINETGTPTVSASYTGAITSASEAFATFKEATSSATAPGAAPFFFGPYPWQEWPTPPHGITPTPPAGVTTASPTLKDPRNRLFPRRRSTLTTPALPPNVLIPWPPSTMRDPRRRYSFVLRRRRGVITPGTFVPPPATTPQVPPTLKDPRRRFLPARKSLLTFVPLCPSAGVTLLDGGYDPTDRTVVGGPYTTGTFTPAANSHLLVTLDSMQTGVGPPYATITVSGGGLTWSHPASKGDGVRWQGYAIAAVGPTSPGAISLTLTQAIDAIGCAWRVIQLTNQDPNNPIVQQVDGGGPGDTTATTTPSMTLSAPADPRNRPIAHFAHRANEATTPRANWLELDDDNNAGPAMGFETQTKLDGFDTTASATWTTSSRWQGMAFEIAAVPCIPVVVTVPTLAWYTRDPRRRIRLTRKSVITTPTPQNPDGVPSLWPPSILRDPRRRLRILHRSTITGSTPQTPDGVPSQWPPTTQRDPRKRFRPPRRSTLWVGLTPGNPPVTVTFAGFVHDPRRRFFPKRVSRIYTVTPQVPPGVPTQWPPTVTKDTRRRFRPFAKSRIYTVGQQFPAGAPSQWAPVLLRDPRKRFRPPRRSTVTPAPPQQPVVVVPVRAYHYTTKRPFRIPFFRRKSRIWVGLTPGNAPITVLGHWQAWGTARQTVTADVTFDLSAQASGEVLSTVEAEGVVTMSAGAAGTVDLAVDATGTVEQ